MERAVALLGVVGLASAAPVATTSRLDAQPAAPSGDRVEALGARESARARRPDRYAFSVWAGAGFNSPGGRRLGLTPDRDFFVAAVRLRALLLGAGRVAVEYTADLLPVAVVSDNPTYQDVHYQTRFGARTVTVVTGRGPVYGAGLSPLGLQLSLAPSRRVRLYAGASAGALFFAREVPVPHARRFNYAFDVGGGVEVLGRSGRAVALGYKLHHLSNAQTATVNPGLDANLFYLALTFPR